MDRCDEARQANSNQWLRVAIREHNRETTTFMKYHWTLAPNFGCLSFRKSHST